MRVALVHDWLVARRGGENVLIELAELYPDAPIYTLVHRPGSVDPRLERHPIHASAIQRLAGATGGFRRYLPFFPRAVEAWDLSAFDLVISTSHCVAIGARTGPGQKHLSYVHTPMRYLRDQLPQYLPGPAPATRALVPLARAATWPLRAWERKAAQGPDRILCNSVHVAQRISQFWRRSANVVYPPVDVAFFSAGELRPAVERHGYLVVAALVPFKRVDVAVRLATAQELELTVVGDGTERRRLERIAGPTVRLLPHVDRAELRRLYARSRALLHPNAEDFGIVPLEASAAGCPTVALARGGALESVIDGLNGSFFDQQSAADLGRAVARFERAGGPAAFDPAAMLTHAERFATPRFVAQMSAAIAELVSS